MCKLPTDEEYLEQLHEMLKDDEWIAVQERYMTHEDAVAAAKMYIAEGSFMDARFDDLVDAIEEATAPSRFFRGQYIRFLRHIALSATEEHTENLKDIPVACLPTQLLNAAAFRTPRGGAIILMDQGVIFHLGLLVRSYLAWRFWHSPEPYCRDHSQDEFALTILRLAHFSATGKREFLQAITTWKCPSLPLHEEIVEAVALGIEIFIILHEFGHVGLNHLAISHAISFATEPRGELTVYTNSEEQEFEADEFAFKHYCRIRERPDDIAFGCALLFHFFNLCERISPPKVRTHPPALHRWNRIRTYVDLSKYPENWANFIDDEFAILGRDLV
jgi:hypothetical protein